MADEQALEIRATILSLLIKQPFLGFIVSKMDFIEDKDSYLGPIPTAATDGKNIFYNRKFFEDMSKDERVFVVAHEILHCIVDTMGRKGDRDHQYWNMASDYAINAMLKKGDGRGNGIGSMPKVGLYERKYEDMTAEQIYAELVKSKAEKKQPMDIHLEMDKFGNLKQTDADGNTIEGKGKGKLTKKELKEIQEQFKNTVAEAYQRTKMAGNELGSIEQLVGDLLTPKIDWRQLLVTTIQSIFKTDMTWMRPSRRMISRNVMLPTLTFSDTADIVVSIDTSGSISDEQRRTFLSEISGILNYYQSFKLKIFCFDTAVHNMQEYDQSNISDLVNYKPKGGGGTDIGCNFEFMEKEGIRPAQFVCFTDGYNCSDSWGPEDYCNTVWIIHSNPNPKVPFGRHALFEDLAKD